MRAYRSAVQVSAEVIDFTAFRAAERVAEAQPPKTALPETPRPETGATVVSLFPEFRLRPTPIVRARQGAAGAPDLVTACDLLVGNFRALQEAVQALQESCRELEADADMTEIGTSGVMLGIAAVSTASETFQQELAATVDAAFR